jgi:type II secretory pathway pseudopilin PulG
MRAAPPWAIDRGMTLAEVLAAAGVIATGLVALASAVPVAWHAVADAGQTSAAFFLANARLEEARRAAWRSTPPEDTLGVSPTSSLPPRSDGATTFADELEPGSLGRFTRQVRISDCGSGAGCGGVVSAYLRQVTVRVFYRSAGPGSAPSAQREVMLTTLVTRR